MSATSNKIKTVLALAAVILTGLVGNGAAEEKPLKIYILAGQSNMEGQAKIETFEYIGDDPATAPLLKEMLGPGGKIGPEFTFGITMEKAYDGPILIIKTAWGGKSLSTDFRPPSAGPYKLNAFQLDHYPKTGRDLEKIKAEKAKATGKHYRLMMEHVRKVLKGIKRVYAAYDPNRGYELANRAVLLGKAFAEAMLEIQRK
jgi:hypothetical protein